MSSHTAKRPRQASGWGPPPKPAIPEDAPLDDRDQEALPIEPLDPDVSMMEGMGPALPGATDTTILHREIGSVHEKWISLVDIMAMVNGLKSLSSFLDGIVDLHDVVIQQMALAHQDDELELDTLAARTFKGSTRPKRYTFTNLNAFLWSRTMAKRSGTLIGSSEVVSRMVKNRSFVWIMPLISAWPPPITCDSVAEASGLWYLELNVAKHMETAILTRLTEHLTVNYEGFFFCTLNNKGEPLYGKWYMRLVVKKSEGRPVPDTQYITDWLQHQMVGLVVDGSVWYATQCCVCMQSSLLTKAKDHHGGNCSLLAMFNKHCRGVNLAPIYPGPLTLVTTLQKEPIKVDSVSKELEKLRKEIKGELGAVVKCLGIVEKKCGLKRAAESEESSTSPKKKKKKAKKGKKSDMDKKEGQKAAAGSSTKAAKEKASKKGKEKEIDEARAIDWAKK
ncbi:hypothetical protein H4582DRAFT_2087107 [Lactarius indigo]|nr:hypothetical protein H4582DRAFT_2087107 [Lactarius indigo]